MRVHVDDRRFSYNDIFETMKEGDINISVIPPHRLVAFHRHKSQEDYWFVVKGSLKVGIVKPDGQSGFVILSDRLPQVLKIERGDWHGYMSMEEEVILVYFITQKYDPNDEERKSVQELNVDWGVEIK